MKSLLTIGRLVNCEVIKPDGSTTKVRGNNCILAWDKSKNNFVTCVANKACSVRLNPAVVSSHTRFHGTLPKGAIAASANYSSAGKIQTIGLCKALTYTVPRDIKSPTKQRHLWHHAFGDTGHKGGNYHESVMPYLCVDSQGNLFFKRRKGNIYTVDEWLRG